jgi:peptidoglycan/LPS O-acetylase OafA/YrhL
VQYAVRGSSLQATRVSGLTSAVRMHSHYRPDIDGLRGISAIAVVLFHAHIPGFRGGFIGVDIFFVISGYLITGILCAPSEQPMRRRLTHFYVRRCRRVLPALLALLVILTPAAIIMLRPADLHTYGEYLASTSILLTNVVAWADRSPGWPPLVHLWTIAVEEQFYLLYPLFLLWLSRRRTRPAVAIAMLAVASFALSVWAGYAKPLANFYLTPPRIWELLLGALPRIEASRVRSAVAREVLALASATVIVLAVGTYSSQSLYPGIPALPVCLAAVSLLVTGQDSQTIVARLLASRPLVVTGLISYSLYLWHAPLLSLFYYRTGASADWLQTALLLSASWLLALASWWGVERQVRSGKLFKSDRHFLLASVMANFVLGGAGLYLWHARVFDNG